jgi:hypothetical protein
VAVLSRPDGQPGAPVFDDQMVIRRGNEDLARAKRFAVGRRSTRKRACALEDSSQRTGTAGRDVQHDADRRRQVAWKSRDNCLERLHATGGGADHDQVSLVAELLEDSG